MILKLIINLLIIFLFTPITFYAQESSYEIKVRKMLELSGAAENFDVAVTNILELQKKSFGEIIDSDYFDQLEKEMKEIGLEKLIPKFTPIYKKYLTEEDLEGIITFYESEVGKRLTSKTPLILKDAMDIGAEWGTEIAEEIIKRIEESKELKFYKVISEDCSLFKEGHFESSDELEEYTFERTDDIQIEKAEDGFINYKIEWVSNNKYLLNKLNESKELETNQTLEVNIYEVNGYEYKWIARFKNSDYFIEGELRKIK